MYMPRRVASGGRRCLQRTASSLYPILFPLSILKMKFSWQGVEDLDADSPVDIR